MHFFALYLTRVITLAGTGQEGNPLFYLVGQDYFIFFGFSVLIGYYAVQWLLKIPLGYKIVGISWMTAITAVDFSHDLLYLMGYKVWFFIHLASHSYGI